MAVEIQADGRTVNASTAADVDQLLDQVTATITAPTLIRLRAAESVLHIGVGDTTGSVALYLDARGRPFFAQGTDAGRPDSDVPSFDQDGVIRQFSHRCWLTPKEARNAAIDFVTHDGVRPQQLRWTAEGQQATEP